MKPTLLSLSLIAALGSHLPLHAEPAKPAVKASKQSMQSGLDLQWLDKSVRPQDDFFRFMSGKWLATAEIPADRGRWGSFDQLRETSEKRIHEIVESLDKNRKWKDGSNEQKIADMYASFMDEATIEQLDIQPIKAKLQQIDSIKSAAEFPALMAQLSRMGVASPFGAGVGQDARESTRYAVYASQSGLSLPDRDYYLKQDDEKMAGFRQAYLAHLEKMLSMAGETEAKARAQSILQLETELAKIQWSKVENRNPVKTYNKVPLEQLPNTLTDFDWNQYFAELGMQGKMVYVIVRQPGYFNNLAKLFKEQTLESWKTYFKWQVLQAYAPYLSKRFADESFAFGSNTLRGVPAQEARWKRGISRVEEALSEAVGQIYVAKYFPPEHKARMQELVNNLVLAYKQSIETLEWMSPQTKQEALQKLAKFTPKIGYPDKWRDYSQLRINRRDLVGNILRGREHAYQRQLAKLGQPVDRSEWGMSPQTVNAYYNSRLNEIVFPAAILQPPFFNAKADDAVNYGGIGAVIGHEISHGFDDSGSQSDGDGNLRDWWTAEDKANFGKLTKAMIEQYNGYSPVAGYNVNGALTLGENIADNSGLAIAFKAYQLSLRGKKSSVIDGYTGEQRVFMGWAQVWRGKAREKEAIRLIATDPHSPAEFRGNGPLVNLPEFYSAFDVKEGDKMYVAPEKRIKIW